jgi:hypothetical protein
VRRSSCVMPASAVQPIARVTNSSRSLPLPTVNGELSPKSHREDSPEPRKTIIGQGTPAMPRLRKPIIAEPRESQHEQEHFIQCPACFRWIDMRNLDEVLAHERACDGTPAPSLH